MELLTEEAKWADPAEAESTRAAVESKEAEAKSTQKRILKKSKENPKSRVDKLSVKINAKKNTERRMGKVRRLTPGWSRNCGRWRLTKQLSSPLTPRLAQE